MNIEEDYFIKKIKKHKFEILIVITYFLLMANRVEFKKNSPDFIVFFLNTMPNFLVGICFPFILYNIFQKQTNKQKSLFFAIIFTGCWLTLEEYYAIFSHNKYFDYYDIFMSWFGTLISFLIIKKNEKN